MSKRLAICIGINEYKNSPNANLEFAYDDAHQMANLLRDSTRGQFDDVIEIYNNDGSKDNILARLGDVFLDTSRTSEDLILVYFSGHGHKDKADNLCLIPYDVRFLGAEEIDIFSTIHITDFQKLADNSKARNVVLILDACYSGSASKLLGGVKYRDDSNIFIIGAARSSQKAWETGELANSSFTSCILRASNLKPSFGEWITLQQILGFTQIEMSKIEDRQTMEFGGHSIDQNIPFIKNPIFRLNSDEFVQYVKDMCLLKQLQIVQTQTDDLFQNVFIVRESVSFGGQSKILVICIDNSQVDVQSGDIYQYNNLFQQFRSNNQIDRGIIVSRKELPTTLKNILVQSMSSIIIDDVLRDLIDFKRHLMETINEFVKPSPERFGDPSLDKCFIEPNLEIQLSDSEQPFRGQLTEMITDWLNQENQPAAIILGGYGTGKSTAVRKIAYDLANNYEVSANKKNLRIPIVFSLRKFPKFSTVDIESYVVAHLKQACKVDNPDFEAFKTMNKEGMLLLIFDGFDEMAIQANANIVRRNFRQIIEFATEIKSKVLITSRPEVFLNESEEAHAYEDFVIASGKALKINRLKILPFSEEQIEFYLQKRVPLIDVKNDWTYYRDQIDQTVGLKFIVERPILLEITIKSLPQLMLEGSIVSRSRIYETYLLTEFSRQLVDKKRDFLIETDASRLRLMEVIACNIYLAENQNGITVDQLHKLLEAEFPADQKSDLEFLVRDFISCSFMVREHDKYLFSHRSFMEFLVAQVICREVENHKPFYLSEFNLDSTVLEFLMDMKPANEAKWRQVLWDWVEYLRFDVDKSKQDMIDLLEDDNLLDNNLTNSVTLGSNAISILHILDQALVGSDLSNMFLSDVYFSGGNLTNVNLRGSVLRRCYFNGGNLTNVNLKGSVLRSCYFNGTELSQVDISEAILHKPYFNETIMRNINFDSVVFQGGYFNNVDFPGAIFSDTIIINTYFNEGLLYDANFKGSTIDKGYFNKVNLSRANFSNITIFNDTHFNGGILHDVDFEKSKINGCCFDASDMSRANINNVKWDNITMKDVILVDTLLDIHSARSEVSNDTSPENSNKAGDL